jgi:nitrogen fixation NifU-like protein
MSASPDIAPASIREVRSRPSGAEVPLMEGVGEYSSTVLDHYRNPRNVGEIEGSPAVAQVGDPAHGDVLRLGLLIAGGRVVDARFKSFGCTAAIAAGSVTTVLVIGRRIDEVERVTNQDVVEALGGLPESKLHCSVLAEQAIREALRRWREAQPRTGEDACR